MANLIIQENGVARTTPAVHGEEITIQAPCDCSEVTGVQIAGVAYPFYDAAGNVLVSGSGLFKTGNLIRVLIDTVNTRATIINRAITPLTVDEIRLICGWQENGLPAGYAFAEYIQSSGAQYIDTGFIPNHNTRVVMDCTLYQSGANACFFCSRSTGSGTAADNFTLFVVSGPSYRWDYYGASVNASGMHNYGTRLTIDANNNIATVGDYTITADTSTSSSVMNLILFASASGTKASYTSLANYATVQLYSCQIYDNETLVRDYVPCTNAYGVYGLWDKVNSKFYKNKGSGSFTGA